MIHIAIHCLPHEIDQLENLLIQLKRNSQYLPDDHGIHVAVELNCKLVDWEKSLIPQSFFFNKFHQLKELTSSWAKSVWFMGDQGMIPVTNIITGEEKKYGHRTSSYGCNDVRRRACKITNGKYLMYLDVDNIFGNTFLHSMYLSVKHLNETDPEGYHVITPQTTRMWDDSWDIITNQDWLSEEASHEKYDVRDPYIIFKDPQEKTIRKIIGFKFAGWGTTMSTNLTRLVGVPESLGSYGLDDTFIMQACYIMRTKNYDVHQYVIEDELIIENNLLRFNPYKNYIHTIDKREEFLAQAHANFPIEIQKLYERL